MKVRAIAVMGRRGMARLRMERSWLGSRGVWRGAFRAALAFTLFFSLYPHDAVQETFSEEVQAFDWLFHALCYASLSATWLLGREERPRGLLPRLDVAFAFASLGCALELEAVVDHPDGSDAGKVEYATSRTVKVQPLASLERAAVFSVFVPDSTEIVCSTPSNEA